MFRKVFVTMIWKMDWSGYRWKQKGETIYCRTQVREGSETWQRSGEAT